MSTNYGPDESAYDIFLERTFLAADFVSGIGYGVQLGLYATCAVYLWSTRKTQKQSIYILAYITVILVIGTINEAAQIRTVQALYIDNRNYPGGPWAYFMATQHLPVDVMFISSLFLLMFLADSIVFWRCWVIWTSSGRFIAYCVIAFPAIMLLASFVMGTLWTLQSSQPGLSFYSRLPLAYGTSYYALSLSVNILLTTLIAVRLLMHRRRILSVLPEDHAKHYVSLATIIIESGSLYSVFAVISLVTYAVNNPINQIFRSIASSAQQIANYLIIYRVAQGRAWRNDVPAKHTTMSFGGPDQATTFDLETSQMNDSSDSMQITSNREGRQRWFLGTEKSYASQEPALGASIS